MAPYLNITSWSHKKLIDLIRAEFPKDVLWEENNINTLVHMKRNTVKPIFSYCCKRYANSELGNLELQGKLLKRSQKVLNEKFAR